MYANYSTISVCMYVIYSTAESCCTPLTTCRVYRNLLQHYRRLQQCVRYDAVYRSDFCSNLATPVDYSSSVYETMRFIALPAYLHTTSYTLRIHYIVSQVAAATWYTLPSVHDTMRLIALPA